MTPLDRFLNPSTTSLKICGVTTIHDANQLVELGVDALGVNFWPKSKRFLDPKEATWLAGLAGRILRVGVFVNEAAQLPLQLWNDGLIDAIQLHGDESPADATPFLDAGAPIIKAIGVKNRDSLAHAAAYRAHALLLDTHAPGVYGGTGECFDWKTAADFMAEHPGLPVILAGGIVPENAHSAITAVHPAAIDIASGAESSPGIKDFAKVRALLNATRI